MEVNGARYEFSRGDGRIRAEILGDFGADIFGRGSLMRGFAASREPCPKDWRLIQGIIISCLRPDGNHTLCSRVLGLSIRHSQIVHRGHR